MIQEPLVLGHYLIHSPQTLEIFSASTVYFNTDKILLEIIFQHFFRFSFTMPKTPYDLDQSKYITH